MLCVINIGHSRKDPGCSNKNYNVTEFEFCNELALDIEDSLVKSNIDYLLVYQDTYSGLPTRINGYNPSLVISLHANAFDTKARGCETLYHLESGESLILADILQKNLNGALHNPNRGVKAKTSDDRGGKLLRDVKAPIVICEPFFLDNDYDYENALDHYDELVESYVRAIKEYSSR
mgnify:CR=1